MVQSHAWMIWQALVLSDIRVAFQQILQRDSSDLHRTLVVWVGALHGFFDHRVTFHPTHGGGVLTICGMLLGRNLRDFHTGPKVSRLTRSVVGLLAAQHGEKKRVAHYLPQSLVLLSLPLSLTTMHCWQSMSRQTMDEVKIGCDKSRGLSFFCWAGLRAQPEWQYFHGKGNICFDIHASYCKFKRA